MLYFIIFKVSENFATSKDTMKSKRGIGRLQTTEISILLQDIIGIPNISFANYVVAKLYMIACPIVLRLRLSKYDITQNTIPLSAIYK